MLILDYIGHRRS